MLRGGEDRVKEWNRRRREGEEIPDLYGEDLRGANLGGADLSEAKLSEAKLRGADFSHVRLGRTAFTLKFLFIRQLGDVAEEPGSAQLFVATAGSAGTQFDTGRDSSVFGPLDYFNA